MLLTSLLPLEIGGKFNPLRPLRWKISKQVTSLTGVPASLILKDEAPAGSYRIRHKAGAHVGSFVSFCFFFLNASRSTVSDGNSFRGSCSA